MRHNTKVWFVTVLAIMMIVPTAAIAEDGTRTRDRSADVVETVTPDSQRVRSTDRATDVRQITDRPTDRPRDRVTDRPRDRRRDAASFRRRLVAAGCVVQLPSGEWEWTGGCGEDDPPFNIRQLINRLVYSHLWKQLYRLLHWLYG